MTDDYDPFVVYLAGPVNNVEDGGKSWRDTVKESYEDVPFVEFRDPLDKYNVSVEDLTIVDEEPSGDDEVAVSKLVSSDKFMIKDSDVLFIGYEPVQSIGTPMEVMWAYERDYPIGMWLRGHEYDDLSPWYKHHVDVFEQMSLKTIERLAFLKA